MRFACAAFLLQACGGGGGGLPPKDAPAPTAAPSAASPLDKSWLGNVSRTYPGDMVLVLGATRASLERLGLAVRSESGGIFRREFELESEDGTSVFLDLAETTKDSTRITIKVGYLLGNADAAGRIHSEIESEVGARRGDADAKKKRWRGVSDLVVVPRPTSSAEEPRTSPSPTAAGADSR